MRTRPLGKTGIVVSEIGFGAWGIGGWAPDQLSYGATDDATSLAALDRAMEIGYSLIDTAPLYGEGHSEELIGQALRGRRDRAVIATKAGYTTYKGAVDYSPQALERSLTESLRRLGTDYVDLLQLHSPPLTLLQQNPDILEQLERFQSRGLIRAFGLSANSPAEARSAIEQFRIPVVQVNFNMLDLRCVSDGLFDAARQHGTALIARTPLCFGFLTGTIAADTIFSPQDHRSRWNGAQVARWVESADAVLALAGATRDADEAEIALRFVLSFSEIATIIPGILTAKEAEENAKASTLGVLAPQVIKGILDYHQHHSVFF
jgi:aryl-alcohol dehydrogenase-like predicted oxidoreductase